MDKILVVEDEIALSGGLCFELDAAGYVAVAAYNCTKAKYFVENEVFSLILLDINLPDGNGFDLCRYMKSICPGLPVIFLTANDLEKDILNGFDRGGEDYITKPFNIKILLRRIEVALRRVRPGAGTVKGAEEEWSDGFLSLRFDLLKATRGRENLTISANEYKLLKILTANAGNILTRQILLEKLWDNNGNYIDDHTLTVAMNRLRAKIEDKEHHYIKTVRGMGYIWMKERK